MNNSHPVRTVMNISADGRSSLLYIYGLPTALRGKGLSDKYKPEDTIKLTNNIYCVDVGNEDEYRVSAIQKKTQDILDKLDVTTHYEKLKGIRVMPQLYRSFIFFKLNYVSVRGDKHYCLIVKGEY